MAAHPLPPGKRQFFDASGNPLAGGTVAYYIPGGTTPKDTYQNSGQTITNTNPVVLDSAGEAIIWGVGSYREVLKDSSGNTIWDQVTETWTDTGDFFDLPFENLGTPPLSSEIMAGFVAVRSMTIPANFDGTAGGGSKAYGFCSVNPTATFTITVNKNGSAVGTITISTGGVFTFATVNAATVVLGAGDSLSFVAQSTTDATLANLWWTITGTLS